MVNEFGEAGLDHDLIEVMDEEVVLMPSGCLCCSIRGDLPGTLRDLFRRRDADQVTFERIVIETTGLADPGPILQTFLVDAYLARYFRMDGVVTVVDAATGPETLNRQFEAISQVAMADLLVMSKTDLVSEAAASAFETRLQTLAPTARILKAERGVVPMAALWDLSGMRPQSKPEQVKNWLSPQGAVSQKDPFENLSGLAASNAHKATTPPATPHDARIGSASIVLDDPIPVANFDLWLDTLVSLRGPDILRVKGIVHLEDMELPFVLHGVQHIFDQPVPMPNWPGEDRKSRVVIIARDMTQAELSRSFDMLRAVQSNKTDTSSMVG